MTESIRPEAGVTNSLPPAINLNLSLSQEPREFVLVVVHNQTGRVFSPFLVRSKDEESARKLCRRSYLDIQSVEPFVEEDGKKKPRTLMYGPPISDRDFEEDYGNRAADPSPSSEGRIAWYSILGWLMCGPLGAVFGMFLHQAIDDSKTRE